MVEPRYGKEKADRILAACWKLEELSDAGALVRVAVTWVAATDADATRLARTTLAADTGTLRLDPEDRQARENLQLALREQKQQQQKQQQQQQKPQSKMSQREAERKLKLLQDKEKELQERLQENGLKGNGMQKDW